VCTQCGTVGEQEFIRPYQKEFTYSYYGPIRADNTFHFALADLNYLSSQKWRRLAKIDNNVVNPYRAARRPVLVIAQICKLLEVPAAVRDRAIYLYHHSHPQKNWMVQFGAAALWVAVRELKYTAITWDHIQAAYKTTGHNFKLSTVRRIIRDHMPKFKTVTVKDYLENALGHFFSVETVSLPYTELVRKYAYALLTVLPKYKGVNPRNLAFAIIYSADRIAAAWLKIPKRLTLASFVPHVKEFSLRNIFYLYLRPHLKKFAPPQGLKGLKTKEEAL
jgi:transcription initiation factor TFIIIB Brf1 subunit/transcription initiation factor TFIIB